MIAVYQRMPAGQTPTATQPLAVLDAGAHRAGRAAGSEYFIEPQGSGHQRSPLLRVAPDIVSASRY
eukprot:COSAG01_NODE_1001_length_12210_cov_60.505491_16_plen_66_part_00